jgi:DNA-binding MarR family transcriptional regulator
LGVQGKRIADGVAWSACSLAWIDAPFYAPAVTRSDHATGDNAISAPVAAAGDRLQNPRELSDRVAMGRALWRELVIGFAGQLGELRLGFTQLAALYVLADEGTTTIADLADALNRSPSATSRLVDGLVRRSLLERRPETEDRRQRTLWITAKGQALLATVDRARADQFLAVVRPLPPGERALIAMGVAALATHAISRRGRLIKSPRP